MEIKSDALGKGTLLNGGAYTYQIEKVLGQGSFGITYLATTRVKMESIIHGPLGDVKKSSEQEVKVAVKEFFMRNINSRSQGSSLVEGSNAKMTQDYRRKFRREAELLSKVKHPHIVQILDVFDTNGTTYYAMQYIEGCSLNEYIEEKKHIEEDEALRLIRSVAESLQYLHSKNMLHLDIKPNNIMLDDAHNPYLIDFGLTKQFDEDGEPESSTTIGQGTPGYAPLEQAHFKTDGAFPATLDIYALGGTLYKMLIGKTPPDAAIVSAYGLNRPSYISDTCWGLISHAMQPQKENRPQTVEVFLEMMNNSQKITDTDDSTLVETIKDNHDLSLHDVLFYPVISIIAPIIVVAFTLIFISAKSDAENNLPNYLESVENCESLIEDSNDENYDAIIKANNLLREILFMDNKYKEDMPTQYNNYYRLESKLVVKREHAIESWAELGRNEYSKNNKNKALYYYHIASILDCYSKHDEINNRYNELKEESGNIIINDIQIEILDKRGNLIDNDSKILNRIKEDTLYLRTHLYYDGLAFQKDSFDITILSHFDGTYNYTAINNIEPKQNQTMTLVDLPFPLDSKRISKNFNITMNVLYKDNLLISKNVIIKGNEREFERY